MTVWRKRASFCPRVLRAVTMSHRLVRAPKFLRRGCVMVSSQDALNPVEVRPPGLKAFSVWVRSSMAERSIR